MESNKRYQEYQEHHKFLKGIPNLSINFGAVKSPEDHPLEQVYYSRLFKHLIRWKSFKDYQFYIIGSTQLYDYDFDEKSIVFCLSNETHEIPEDMLSARIIFSPYCPIHNRPPNCFPVPLGYNGSLHEVPFKQIKDRKYGIFYSGNIYKKRMLFFLGIRLHQIMTRIKSLFVSAKSREYIQFTRKFTGGLSPAAYSEILMDTRIALVPEGYRSDVSFRFFEAAKMGCIIVTRELYDYWFFKEFPGIQLKSWIGFHWKIAEILADPVRQSDIQKRMIAYYDQYCSEEATAKYVIDRIETFNAEDQK